MTIDTAPREHREPIERVWEPIQIGGTTLRNRIMTSAHTLLYGEGGQLSERHIAYYTARARGGIGLLMTEQLAVDSRSLGAYRGQCSAYEPRSIDRLAQLAEAVHAHGAAQFAQLFATGAQSSATGALGLENWGPLQAPSVIPTASYRETPYAMSKLDITRLVESFSASAANVNAAGLDGVEVHAAHGYMLGQFLSPAYNRRLDEYGIGDRAGTRLVVQILDSIRTRVGASLPLGIRIGLDEYMGGRGITPELAEEQLDLILGEGLIDFVDVSAGNYHTNRFGYELERDSPGAMGVMDSARGFNLVHSRRAKAVAAGRVAVMTVGGLRELEDAANALDRGDADVLGMTRAHIADPELMRKHAEGRAEEVVRCVGANECTSRLVLGREVICVVNPTTGREAQWAPRASIANIARKVTVVGGGPAGLRFAATAAEKGHEVTLLESTGELGGHLTLLSTLPGRHGWRAGVHDLVERARRSGVVIQTYAPAGQALGELPDATDLVVATGATWDSTGFSVLRPDLCEVPGRTSLPTFGIDDAVRRTNDDPAALGGRVLIVDESGGYLPIGLALRLATVGVQVEIMSPFSVGEHAIRTMDAKATFPALLDLGVTMSSGQSLHRITPTHVSVSSIWGGPERCIQGVETVVFSTSRTPNVELYESLASQRGKHPWRLHRLGDALAPRSTVEIIVEAEGAARELR